METYKGKRGITFRESGYIGCKKIYSPFFKRKTDARKWKFNFEAAKSQGKIGIYQASKIPFRELAETWVQERTGSITSRTMERNKEQLKNHLLPFLGDAPLNLITKQHGKDLLNHLKSKNKASGKPLSLHTGNMVLCLLKQILDYAVQEHGYLHENPVKHVKKHDLIPYKNEILSKEEIIRFLDSNQEHHFFPFWIFSMNNCVRASEVGGLCWDVINFEQKTIEIKRTLSTTQVLQERTKTESSKRVLKMNEVVFDLLTSLAKNKQHPQLVFTNKGKPIDIKHLSREFKKALKKANITKKCRFHDVRGSFASNFLMSGGLVYELMRMGGWSNMETLMKHYARYTQDFLENASKVIQFAPRSSVHNLGPKLDRSSEIS